MTTYRHTATGIIYRPGQIVAGQQTHNRMSAAAWADLGCEPYTPPPPPDPPTEAEQAAAEAASLATEHPDLPATVRAAFVALQSLVSMGVQIDLTAGIPGWQAIGPAIAARRLEIATLPDAYAALDAAADMADGYWRAVVYWCGSDRAAYRLAPALAQLGV